MGSNRNARCLFVCARQPPLRCPRDQHIPSQVTAPQTAAFVSPEHSDHLQVTAQTTTPGWLTQRTPVPPARLLQAGGSCGPVAQAGSASLSAAQCMMGEPAPSRSHMATTSFGEYHFPKTKPPKLCCLTSTDNQWRALCISDQTPAVPSTARSWAG